MLRAYKTEIKPNKKQRQKIQQGIGICRFLYNSYLAKNQELYEQFKNGEIDKEQAFMSANNFDKYINNEVKIKDEFKWINLCGSKARKKSICDAETAYKRFFKGQSNFPKFKKKNKQEVKMYFPKNNKGDWTIERHKVQIPTIGKVVLKEKGYIPTDKIAKSGTISYKAGRYYISVLIEDEKDYTLNEFNEGIGIDLGLKDFAIVSNLESPFKNINKTSGVKKLEKKLKREQRKLSRKYESLKKNKIKKGETTRQIIQAYSPCKGVNLAKQIAKVQKLHQRLSNIRENHINQVINKVVKSKPLFITIEDLNVRGMMKNKHLAKAIAGQCFNQFRVKLTWKCSIHGIELRVVDRFYPSSKLCSYCENIKKDLKLSDRVYKCECCKIEIDRDKNASINLANAKTYKVAQ